MFPQVLASFSYFTFYTISFTFSIIDSYKKMNIVTRLTAVVLPFVVLVAPFYYYTNLMTLYRSTRSIVSECAFRITFFGFNLCFMQMRFHPLFLSSDLAVI